MWTTWQASHLLLIWITLQLLCTAVSGLRHKTACYNFMLMVDPPCAATEMLLPTMFTLGVSSDVTCHSEISGASLKQKGVDEIRRCCQQRENDTVTDYCLPATKNQLPDHYYLEFVNTCTAATRCQLPSPGSVVKHTAGEDYVTFTFECVHKDTVLHIQRDSTYTGQEVYLYNDQHDGIAHANCLAYTHECNSHVIIQLAAARVVSAACSVDFTDGDVSTKADCKNPPASRNCSSAMFESKSNFVNMSIYMSVDPGRQEKEFLWIRAKADTGTNVTVACGANIPSYVSLNCPTSAATTTTAATTATTTTQTVTSNNASGNHTRVAVTSSTEVVIIGSSVGGVILIAIIVTITVCVRRQKRNSSEKTNGHMEKKHEDGNEPNGTRNSVSDGYVRNPIYEGTDDYKLEQLHRKTSGDINEGYEPGLESPYGFTHSGPARSALSLGKTSCATQGHLDYFDDKHFNTGPIGGNSEEKSDGRVSDPYAKVNKAQGTDQVTDVYTQVDKPRKPARGTSGQYSDGEDRVGQDEDISATYAKVQKK